MSSVLESITPYPRTTSGQFRQFLGPWPSHRCSLRRCCSVSKSCPTLCDPMDCSMPGFPVLHCLPEFTQIHIHWVSVAIQSSHPLPPPSPLALNLSQHWGLFPMSQLFASSGQSVGASASASVLPMNIQGWFPLGLTGLISLQSKGLSRAFSSTTIWKDQFFSSQPSLWFKSHICIWLMEKTIALTIQTFISKVMSLLFNTLVNNECSYCRAGFPQILTCIKSC